MTSELNKFYRTSEEYHKILEKHDEKYFGGLISAVKQNIPLNSKILDLGCGRGLSSYLVSEIGYEVIGCDINPFLEELKKKQADSRVQYTNGDILNLPFKENSFDAVILKDVIEHIPDVKRCLLEIVRILKSEGILIIMSPCLITPLRPLISLLKLIRGKEGIPVWGENKRMCLDNVSKFSIRMLQKLFLYAFRRVDFKYRTPDFKKAELVGGDADAVYWANPFDLIVFLRNEGLNIKDKFNGILYGFMGTTKIIAIKR